MYNRDKNKTRNKCSGNSHSKHNTKNTTFCCSFPLMWPWKWPRAIKSMNRYSPFGALTIHSRNILTFHSITFCQCQPCTWDTYCRHPKCYTCVFAIHTAVTQSAIHVSLQYTLQSPKVLYKCFWNTAVNQSGIDTYP